MNYYYSEPPLPLENSESNQLTEHWDLMHIIHGVQRHPLKQVQKFSYLHTQQRKRS